MRAIKAVAIFASRSWTQVGPPLRSIQFSRIGGMLWSLVILLPLTVTAPVWAACSGASPNRTSASANYVDVKDCLAAAADGDTITVPAGSATWTSPFTITKFVKLIASGTVTITDNSAGGDPDAGGGPSLITIVESTAGASTIQGFTFVSGTGVHLGRAGIIEMNSSTGGQPILIAGNTFTQSSSGNAIVAHTNRGVIWSNTFTGVPYGSNCFDNTSALRHKPSGFTSSWSTPSAFGSADTTGTGNLYFETNTLTYMHEGIDVDDNGRTVVRQNEFTNSAIILHGVDTSGIYGARYADIHNNTWAVDQTPLAACGGLPSQPAIGVFVRGGTVLVHDNVIPNPTGPTWGPKVAVQFLVEELRRNAGGFPCWSTNIAPGAGYPAPHQAGWGYTTGATTVTGSNCANCPVRQDPEPIYLWNNTGGGNYDTPSIPDWSPNQCPSNAPSVSLFIQSGRDYFTRTAKPGYTPYEYPHPLTGGAGGALAAPTGLIVR